MCLCQNDQNWLRSNGDQCRLWHMLTETNSLQPLQYILEYHFIINIGITGLRKQCRLRSDNAESLQDWNKHTCSSWEYITRAPHAGANARLQFLLEIYRACLIISNYLNTLNWKCHNYVIPNMIRIHPSVLEKSQWNHFSTKFLSRKRDITVQKIFWGLPPLLVWVPLFIINN